MIDQGKQYAFNRVRERYLMQESLFIGFGEKFFLRTINFLHVR